MKQIDNFINGKITKGNSRKYLDDPSTGEIISEVILSDKTDFNNVIESSVKLLKFGLK